MNRKRYLTLFILLLIMFSTACNPKQIRPTPTANLPNPAAAYCEQHGGILDLKQAASGAVAGVCIFPDGSECEEWTYFRGECQPETKLVTPPGPTASAVAAEPAPTTTKLLPTATPNIASGGWKIYRNEELGYSFHYPADAQIVANDEPLKSISIAGPEVGGERWPQFTISHPSDREEYRLPVNADLEQWLGDHNLLGETRQPDIQIAGITAIHVRHDRSPQSYAYDRYFFAKSGQLYSILIGHTADKEDWELYNHFLRSFQFETRNPHIQCSLLGDPCD